MCPPACLETLYGRANRRGVVRGGLMAAAAVAWGTHGAAATGSAAPVATGTRTYSNVLDMTHTLFEGFPTFDGSKWFTIGPMFTYAKNGLNINRWMVVEHTGTHMDAPLHFSRDGASVDLLPITDLLVPMAVIDIEERAMADPDSAVTPDDIKKWEAKNGPLPESCCVVMKSGWYRLLDSPKFAGRDQAGKNHTPGFHGETAHMLMTERNVKGLGVDTLSLDTGLNSNMTIATPFPVHYSWLPSGRWGVENLANLDQVPAKGAYLLVGGPKVKGGTGGPSRVVAFF
ncbi:MAG: cyclase family protein [Alphaproteobacteria bacterium]|nr:cyclase family protein [Alphaproteobacteria bacterium]